MSAVYASFLVAIGAAGGFFAALAVLRRRDGLRARFLSFVAHEINTPLTALNMTVLNFLQGAFGEVSKDHEPWLKLIRGDVDRLSVLVGELRDLIHLDFHRDLALTVEVFSFSALVEERIEAVREGFSRAGAALELRVEPGLPDIEGDEDRLKRCVHALLEHARKFRMKDGVAASVKRAESEDRLEFRVDYQGERKDPEDVAQALDLYYPVHRPKAQVLSGVGLGLGLPNELVKLHGGSMSLEVSESGATSLRIILPVKSEGVHD